MKTRQLPLFLALAILASPALCSQASPILGALKGPSGIALVQLFDHPPALPGGRVLSVVAVPSADIMAAKVIGGEFAAAVLPINMAAKLRASGLPLVLGAIIGNGMVSLLTDNPRLAALADLRGQQLDVAGQGATPDFLLRRLLKDAGLDPDKDLRLAYALPYPEMAAALAAGKIHQALLPEPFATLARMNNSALRAPIDIGALWTKSTGMADYPMTALVFSTKAGLSQEEMGAILDAAKASIAAVVARPAEAGVLVEKHELGLKAPVAAAAIPRCNFAFETATEARPSIEVLLGEFLAFSPASIGGRLPDDAFYATF